LWNAGNNEIIAQCPMNIDYNVVKWKNIQNKNVGYSLFVMDLTYSNINVIV